MLLPMIEQTNALRCSDTIITADAGYHSKDNLNALPLWPNQSPRRLERGNDAQPIIRADLARKAARGSSIQTLGGLNMHPILREYESSIDAICGTMVRVCFSLPGQRNSLRKLASEAGVPLDTPLRSSSFGPDRFDDIHTATIQDQLLSLEDGGTDEVLVGNICISFVYALWEDNYRPAFAKQRGLEKNAVRSELFRELATYRHAIVHNHAVGTSKTEKLELLPSVPRGAALKVDRHLFELIVGLVKKELHAISRSTTAAQPGSQPDAAR